MTYPDGPLPDLAPEQEAMFEGAALIPGRSSRTLSAAVSPAMPDPMTTTSAWVVQPGAGASSRSGRTGSVTTG